MDKHTPLPTSLPAWLKLSIHQSKIERLHMRDLFAEDPERFQRFSVEACGLLLDYSKNRIVPETMELLLDLAQQVELPCWIERMFSGSHINNTEDRAALHVALRHGGEDALPEGDNDVMPAVRRVLGKMDQLTEAVESGAWRGHTGKRIRTIINIGIGGSDLGPALVVEALERFHHEGMQAHFVSNLDSSQLDLALAQSDPESTLFLIISKSFTTQETMCNAASAQSWLIQHLGDPAAVSSHFLAVTSKPELAMKFGIGRESIFEMWDWVGGRYSLWSAVGLSIALMVGMKRFRELLAGAHEMDVHFRTAPLAQNLPVILGLLGIWYRNFFSASSHAILPYDYALRTLPQWAEQVEMESNGKRVTRNGETVDYATCPVIWGASGNNGQHAFFQLLHQGTDLIPADFLAAIRCQEAWPGHEAALIANALAQSRSLMAGRTDEEMREALQESGLAGEALEAMLPFREYPGNQPSNTILYERLNPRVLGTILALYEHKVFVQGVCWGINSFDQWGVELGKQVAKGLLRDIQSKQPKRVRDGSTVGLMAYVKSKSRWGVK